MTAPLNVRAFGLASATRRLTTLCALLALYTCHPPLGAPAAVAQTPVATLSGSAVDERRALLPGVTVTMTNDDTAARRETVTNEDGQFVFALLAPGRYTLTARRHGFSTVEVKSVVISVGDQLSLELRLRVGGPSESVTVKDTPTLLTESPAVSAVVDRRFVENLPLNGRSFTSLIELAPGAVLARDGRYSVNGQRTTSNYFSVDGVGANFHISNGANLGRDAGGAAPALTVSGTATSLVSVDALQEFRVHTSTYAPEFGRSPGAQVSVVTRSGTNRFHGTLFEYLRNDALDANDWYANKFGLKKPPLRQNNFGGVLGGPLVADRTFFFLSYEGLRLRQPHVGFTLVPALGVRRDAPPPLKVLLDAFPVPNGRDFGDGFAEFVASFSSPTTVDATSFRLDHTLGQGLTLFGRFNHAPSDIVGREFLVLSNVAYSPTKVTTLTFGATQAVTPKVSNDFRFNYSRSRAASFYRMDDFGGAAPPGDQSLFPHFASSADGFYSLLLGPLRWVLGKNVNNLQRQVNVINNLSAVTGPHQLRFGIDYRRLSPLSEQWTYSQQTNLGGVSSVLTGRARDVIIAADTSRAPRALVVHNFSAYGQDTWKVSRRLTLVYGLRWEFNPEPSERNGHQTLAVTGADDPPMLRLAPAGTARFESTYDNFAPRFGAVHRLFRAQGYETTLRGGFGLFHDHLATSAIYSVFPYISINFIPDVALPLTEEQAAPPSAHPGQPRSLLVLDPRLRLPRTYHWNTTAEQSLGTDQTISVAYVGAAGRRLLRQERYFMPNPAFDWVDVINNGGSSDYHSLQVEFERRLSRGLQARAAYAWSHSIDNASSDGFVNTESRRVDPRLDRGPSDFDVRHSLTVASTYDIPIRVGNGVSDWVLRGWSLDAIFRARTATPINIQAGNSLFGVGGATRPDLIRGVPLYLNDPEVAGGRRVNRAAFSIPPAGRQGTLGRNALRGFPVSQLDLSVRRRFTLTEQLKLQLRADLFNALNHPNFADPFTNLSNAHFFGQSLLMLNWTIGGLDRLYQIGGPRSVQLAMKLQF